MAPSSADLVVMIALCVIAPMVEARWLYPWFTRAVAANPGARSRWYAVMLLVVPWALTGAVLAIWAVERRPWSALYLGPARALGIWLGLGLSVLSLASYSAPCCSGSATSTLA
jgi:hypothetical protein